LNNNEDKNFIKIKYGYILPSDKISFDRIIDKDTVQTIQDTTFNIETTILNSGVFFVLKQSYSNMIIRIESRILSLGDKYCLIDINGYYIITPIYFKLDFNEYECHVHGYYNSYQHD